MTQHIMQSSAVVAAFNFDLGQLVGALVYSIIGIALFGLAFFIIVKVAPFSIRKEIEDDQNTALGIIIGAVIIGISLIIGAGVGG